MKIYKCKECGKRIKGTGKTGKCLSCSRKGVKFTKQHIKNLSKAHIGKPQSKVTRNKRSKTLKGRKITWGDKISKTKLGKKPSKSTRDKISKATKIAMENPEIRKKLIGREVTNETRKKLSQALTIHGLGRFPYPLEFRFIRKLILERDNHKCQNCGLTQEEHYNKWEKDIEVHHIDYDKFNCDKTDLITLCKKCNACANKDRDYWYAYYTYKMENQV
jgi:5-methylcytosine-specific restriction endonuclease McrA